MQFDPGRLASGKLDDILFVEYVYGIERFLGPVEGDDK